jgi:hypothetical protein
MDNAAWDRIRSICAGTESKDFNTVGFRIDEELLAAELSLMLATECFSVGSVVFDNNKRDVITWLRSVFRFLSRVVFNDNFVEGYKPSCDMYKKGLVKLIERGAPKPEFIASMELLQSFVYKTETASQVYERAASECQLMINAAAVAYMFVRFHHLAAPLLFPNFESFEREILTDESILTAVEAASSSRQTLFHYTQWAKVATMINPVHRNQCKIIDVASRLSEGIVYARGGCAKAKLHHVRKLLYLKIAGLPPSKRREKRKMDDEDDDGACGDPHIDEQLRGVNKAFRADLGYKVEANMLKLMSQTPSRSSSLSSTSSQSASSLSSSSDPLDILASAVSMRLQPPTMMANPAMRNIANLSAGNQAMHYQPGVHQAMYVGMKEQKDLAAGIRQQLPSFPAPPIKRVPQFTNIPLYQQPRAAPNSQSYFTASQGPTNAQLYNQQSFLGSSVNQGYYPQRLSQATPSEDIFAGFSFMAAIGAQGKRQ